MRHLRETYHAGLLAAHDSSAARHHTSAESHTSTCKLVAMKKLVATVGIAAQLAIRMHKHFFSTLVALKLQLLNDV